LPCAKGGQWVNHVNFIANQRGIEDKTHERYVPHFTLDIDAAGPTVNAQVNVSEGRRTALESQGVAVPPPRVVRALIDTGASFSSVEPTVLAALGLTPTGTIDFVTPSTGQNVVTTDTYDVDVVIYKGPKDPPLSMPNLRVAACELFLRQGIHALIGRDILSKCILIYNGELNEFSLAF
jgi:predicted aspartyl protease